MLASLNSQHSLRSAVRLNTFKPQHNLLCSFSLFLENRLSLPTIAILLPVIPSLSLGIRRILALLALCRFVGLVLATLLTESPAGFRNVHHVCESGIGMERAIIVTLIYIVLITNNVERLCMDLLSSVS